MKKGIFIITLLTGAFMMSACDQSKKVTEADLMHHHFTLIKVNGETISDDKQADIEFTENFNIVGKMCNRFLGKVTMDNGIIKSDGLVMTKMLCADDQLNTLDNVIGQMFENGVSADLVENQLILKDKDNELVYQLKD